MNGISTPSPPLAAAPARDRLAEYARRNADMFGGLDLDRPVRNSEWTVGDTAAHLIFALRGFTDSAAGQFDEWVQLAAHIPPVRTTERVAALNRLLIPNEPRRTPQAVAKAITDGVDRFLSVTQTLPPSQRVPTPWYGEGETLSVAEATRLLLGEQVMHGYDVARTVGRKWPITRDDALLLFEVVRAMFPKIVNPATVGTTDATFRLHMGRGAGFVVRLADGQAVVEEASGQRAQVHLLGDPVALALVGYGRTNQWSAIARGRLFAWGTKPWLAFRFKSFFFNP